MTLSSAFPSLHSSPDYCAPNPLCEYSSPTTTHVGWQSSGSWRDSFDILYSCLATLLACAWSIQALNVPAKNDKLWRKVLRRVKWMCITLAFPEFITAVALTELWRARQTRDDIKKTLKPNAEPWTLTHGFFVNMGGYVLVPQEGDREPFPLTGETLLILVENDLIDVPDTELDAIQDRSKTDSFARVFTLMQLAWTVIQSIARYEEDLPLAPLEVITVWFILPSVFTFVLEWYKPKDVDVPIEIQCHGKIEQGIVGQLSEKYVFICDKGLEDTATDSVARIPFARPVIYYLGDGVTQPGWVIASMFFIGCAMGAYNAAHLLVHPNLFDSKWYLIWRYISITAAILPVVPMLLNMFRRCLPARISDVLLSGWIYVYAFARVFLLVMSVDTLVRSLPVNAYYGITWTNFIPHF
ncbi:hypothetical protein N7510_010082 [Penicillium lagena]|uniref:uncharacterized protein n=1 Tax=Penicillium lagena TaxID=94218 RepID=UPI0025407419|nr:uncharacterized protein N7510_010082 [Penicillium lagena]KAJ5604928.1 hypothetical protein N7510_010082 [Penicillium lagena]